MTDTLTPAIPEQSHSKLTTHADLADLPDLRIGIALGHHELILACEDAGVDPFAYVLTFIETEGTTVRMHYTHWAYCDDPQAALDAGEVVRKNPPVPSSWVPQ